jgi:hypothetical protein
VRQGSVAAKIQLELHAVGIAHEDLANLDVRQLLGLERQATLGELGGNLVIILGLERDVVNRAGARRVALLDLVEVNQRPAVAVEPGARAGEGGRPCGC